MKILIIGRFYIEGFALYVAEELERLGHTVVRFDPGPRLLDSRARLGVLANRMSLIAHRGLEALKAGLGVAIERRLHRVIEQQTSLDLVICTHDFLQPRTTTWIKKATHAPLALWYPDPVWSFGRHRFLNAPFDYLFFKDPFLVNLLRRNLELPVHYLPECYSPHSLEPLVLNDDDRRIYECDITTAGNLYAYRIAFFSQLAEFDVKMWGLPAPRWAITDDISGMIQNRFVAHKTKAKAFRAAKIVVNNFNPSEVEGVNVRTFEIAGAGGFQVCEWRPGVQQLFAEGVEIVCFRSITDLKDKLRYYLKANEEREAIAAAGHIRAKNEHTYRHRLTLLLETVFQGAGGYPLPEM